MKGAGPPRETLRDTNVRSLRVLYVTSELPYPLTSGKLRHYFLMRELAGRHSVSLLALTRSDVEPEHVAVIARFASVEIELEDRSRRSHALRVLGLADRLTNRLATRIDARVSAGQTDVVVLTSRRTFALSRQLRRRGIPLVNDLCDAASLHMLRRLRHVPPLKKPLFAVRYLVRRRREQHLLAESHGIMFGSPRDRQAILGHSPARAQTNLAVVPNGVDLEYWHRGTSVLGEEIVFSGAMDYPPNTDAALYLIDEIMPLVRRSVPNARLRIVGRDPTRELLARAAVPGVSITGFVDDMRPHLEQAAVFATPLRFGAGIQNKLLEAMAMEIPCVATSLAAAGLATEDGAAPPIDIADAPAEFAAHLLRRLRAASDDRSPDAEARRYVSERFSWTAAGAKLQALLLGVSEGLDRSAPAVEPVGVAEDAPNAG